MPATYKHRTSESLRQELVLAKQQLEEEKSSGRADILIVRIERWILGIEKELKRRGVEWHD